VRGQALWALIVATWREKLSRPMIVVLCVLLCVAQSAFAISVRDLQDPVLIMVLILGAGSVGRDASSGVLALVFTRPLVRATYVLSKWIAISTAGAALSWLTLIAQAVLLRNRGIDISAAELFSALFGSLTSACGIGSVLVLLSVLIRGAGDIALWVGLGVLGFLAQKALPLRISDEWRALLQPSLGWASTFGATPIGWFALISYLSSVTLCLTLAVLAINRKQISYASG
jgi:ABC-type transport system involved in multi-copper enzyme maturation permease subunit